MLNTLILVKKKLENEIMFLKSDIMEKQEILRKIKRVIDNNCQHNWITDYIDTDPEHTERIIYCDICERSKEHQGS